MFIFRSIHASWNIPSCGNILVKHSRNDKATNSLTGKSCWSNFLIKEVSNINGCSEFLVPEVICGENMSFITTPDYFLKPAEWLWKNFHPLTLTRIGQSDRPKFSQKNASRGVSNSINTKQVAKMWYLLTYIENSLKGSAYLWKLKFQFCHNFLLRGS